MAFTPRGSAPGGALIPSVGIVGLGHNGMEHLRAHVKHGRSRVTVLCDRNETRLREAKEIAPDARATTGDDIYSDPEVDAISINTGDRFHCEPFVKAMESGKHVFIEKPVSDSLDEIRRMHDSWQRCGRSLAVAVGYVLRWNPLFEQVHEMCNSGRLGRIFYMEADYVHNLFYQRNQTDPVTGRNWYLEDELPMVGGGSHQLDALRWLSGREVVEVAAYANKFSFAEMKNEDCQVALYRLDDGAIAKVAALYGPICERPKACNLRVYGTEGTIENDSAAIRSGSDEVHPPYQPITHEAIERHPYDGEILDWLDAIVSGRQPRVPFWDGANSTIATLCAVQALRSGRPAKVPHIAKEGEWVEPAPGT